MPRPENQIDAATVERIAEGVVRKVLLRGLLILVVLAAVGYWQRDRITNAAKDAVLSKMESKFRPLIDEDKKRIPWLFAPELIGEPLEYSPVE